VVALAGEQRWSSESRAEVKTGSVVMRRGEMERGSTSDADVGGVRMSRRAHVGQW
jgi:hypothetical protein